jgi:hypothetical protein
MKQIIRVLILFSFFIPFFKASAFLCFDELAYAYRKLRPGVEDVALERAVQIAVPSQHLLGYPRIVVFTDKLLNADWMKLKRILEEKPVPYVLGPDGRRHIIDRHHTLYTLHSVLPKLKAKGFPVEKLKMEFRLVDDLSHLNEKDYFTEMNNRKWLYPLTKDGIEDPYSIPSHVSLLEFDFYRGLAWLVRKSGAIQKDDNSVPFLEFYWAKQFKDHFGFKDEEFSQKKIRKAIEFSISRSKKVSTLPGYHQTLPQNMTVDTCMLKIEKILKILEDEGVLIN